MIETLQLSLKITDFDLDRSSNFRAGLRDFRDRDRWRDVGRLRSADDLQRSSGCLSRADGSLP